MDYGAISKHLECGQLDLAVVLVVEPVLKCEEVHLNNVVGLHIVEIADCDDSGVEDVGLECGLERAGEQFLGFGFEGAKWLAEHIGPGLAEVEREAENVNMHGLGNTRSIRC